MELGSPQPILYVQYSADLYGASRALLHLIGALDRSRFTPLVALPAPGPLVAHLRALDVEPILAPYIQTLWGHIVYSWRIVPFAVRMLPAALQLRRLIQRHSIALVHTNMWTILTGALGARLARTPHIWHVREVLPAASGMRAGLARLSLGSSQRVICVSQAVAGQFAGYAQASRVRVVYDGLPAEQLARPPHQKADSSPPLLIGLVGRLHPQKGQAELLYAFARLPAPLRAQSRIAIVGGPSPGHERLAGELVTLAHRLNIAEQVTFYGFREDAQALIARFDVLVLPATRAEGLGGVLLEAMAAQVPVLASHTGGIAEVIAHEANGLLAPPGDSAALSIALARLLSNAALRQQLAHAARQTVIQRFSAAQAGQAIMRIYDETLATTPR